MKTQELSFFPPDSNETLDFPLFLAPVTAGFPSPAEDFMEQRLDLNQHLIEHPAATFFVRVEGDSMHDAGILRGDVLIVDRALRPSGGKIIIAVINGEFTVKRIRIQNKTIFLEPQNPKYPSIEVDPEADFQTWGIVTYIIHKAT